ncbi:putative aerobic-type carbon monoxide dehydrogenase small subunit [Mycobacterium xenopi 3993]|nr:putative aerobic-type carbon monoxide dehydrogenase small subunit [Mycobacterium xenopi 3993]
MRSCLIFAVQVDGQQVTTVEGIAGPMVNSRRCRRRCASATACNVVFAHRVSSPRSPRFCATTPIHRPGDT